MVDFPALDGAAELRSWPRPRTGERSTRIASGEAAHRSNPQPSRSANSSRQDSPRSSPHGTLRIVRCGSITHPYGHARQTIVLHGRSQAYAVALCTRIFITVKLADYSGLLGATCHAPSVQQRGTLAIARDWGVCFQAHTSAIAGGPRCFVFKPSLGCCASRPRR